MMPGGSQTSTSVFPDEILLRHARSAAAAAGHGSTVNNRPDFNNNFIHQSCDDMTDQLLRRFSDISSTPSGGDLIPIISSGNVPGEVTRIRNQLEESFRQERKNLLERIEELETLNAERQEDEERQILTIRELEHRNHSLSQKITKALSKNAALVDENAALKSSQQTLSARVSSLEEKLQGLDTATQETMNSLLKRLEKRESGLKNQAKRLAQLESYYTRELNLISYASAKRLGLPEIGQEDSVTIIHPPRVIVPPPRPHYASHQFEPPLQPPLMATEKYRIQNNEDRTYSELYYKTITDKAMNLIKRETDNCTSLLNKYDHHRGKAGTGSGTSPNMLLLATSSDTEYEHEATKVPAATSSSKGKSTNATIPNEEEDMLRLLFYKF